MISKPFMAKLSRNTSISKTTDGAPISPTPMEVLARPYVAIINSHFRRVLPTRITILIAQLETTERTAKRVEEFTTVVSLTNQMLQYMPVCPL